MFTEELQQLATLDRNAKRLKSMLPFVLQGIDDAEEAILTVSSRQGRISPKIRGAEIQKCITAIYLIDNNEGGRMVVDLYRKLLTLRGRLTNRIEEFGKTRAFIVDHLVINHSDNITVKSVSIGHKGKEAQLTVLYNGQSMTRHLKFLDGAWWGKPLIGQHLIPGFIRYNVMTEGETRNVDSSGSI
jgi:hypothetical protein